MAAPGAKLALSQQLRQQLVMTPQLQQAIKILQLPLHDLEAMVQGEIEQNPMLERSEQDEAGGLDSETSTQPTTASDTPDSESGEAQAANDSLPEGIGNEDGTPEVSDPALQEGRDAALELKELQTLDKVDWGEYLENYSNNWHDGAGGERDDERRSIVENAPARKSSLEEHLLWQMRLSELDEGDQRLGAAIIYNLDDDGYLAISLEEIALQLETDIDRVEHVLACIQRFDPPGVAARNLGECLSLQLANIGMEDSLAARIAGEYLSLLEKHRYGEIAKLLGVPSEAVAQASRIISLLEPKPGRNYGGQDTAYIVPDVYIQKLDDEYVVLLNEDMTPRLRYSRYYQRVLRDDGVNSSTREYLQERLRSARWLVKSIYQRQQTILKVAGSIVKFQRDFFDHGIGYLRPLVLKDVADDVGMHESTISRATANKYAHTPLGIFELKFFFTSSVRATSGEEISAETVKEKIRVMIAAEDAHSPLSDQAIAENLRRDHLNIARRTVAKYRQALGILASARRKLPD